MKFDIVLIACNGHFSPVARQTYVGLLIVEV